MDADDDNDDDDDDVDSRANMTGTFLLKTWMV
jgi:hypothetical protein